MRVDSPGKSSATWWNLPREVQRLRWEIQRLSDQIGRMEVRMAGELGDLQAKVAQNTNVVDSAIVLITGIKTALDAAIAANNPQALKDLSTALGAEDDKLAAAIVANTPAASMKSVKHP